jgi:hypothetical protein
VTVIVVVNVTSTLLAEEAEPAKAESPLYVATIVCTPTGSELTVRLAAPDAKLTTPRDVLPSENVMLPVGTPVPVPGVTFEARTIGLPSRGAVGEAESVVVVLINEGGEFEP